MLSIHFIRPWVLVGFIGVAGLYWLTQQRTFALRSWLNWCDKPLLDALVQQQQWTQHEAHPFRLFLLTLSFLLIAASGPAWQKLPAPVYTQTVPKVILLDISPNMQAADVAPNRLQRGLFVIQDLLKMPHITPIGLIAYTQEPFVVSPLTEDADTISALLPALTEDIAPIAGQDLAQAIHEAQTLLGQSHAANGSILVLTGTPPDAGARDAAQILEHAGFPVSILPIVQQPQLTQDFKTFSEAGGGQLLSIRDTALSLKQWIDFSQHLSPSIEKDDAQFPRWRDEGRWFLIPALLFLAPVFRRGWLRRIEV